MESTKFFVAKIKIFSHTPNICRRKKFTLIETHVMMTCADERFYLVSPQLGADSPFFIQKAPPSMIEGQVRNQSVQFSNMNHTNWTLPNSLAKS